MSDKDNEELDRLFGSEPEVEEHEESIERIEQPEQGSSSSSSGVVNEIENNRTPFSQSENDKSDEDMEHDDEYLKMPLSSSNNTSTVSKNISLKQISRPSEEGFIPYLFKLPGFIGSKTSLYDSVTTLKQEIVETDFTDYGDLLRACTTIRNRKLPHGSGVEVESNSRLNRWSDGSWTLQIGGEHFEVLPQAFRSEEHNLLFYRHEAGNCLESVGKLANKLTARPFMDSTGSHRKYLTLAEATGKGMKKTKVRVATTIMDPEKEKQNLVKVQQDRIKARRKLDAKRRNIEQRSYDRVGRDGLSARFLEAGEGEEEGFDPEAEEDDEYDAEFIDDGEIEEEGSANDSDIETNTTTTTTPTSATIRPSTTSATADARSKTSRLIFDDDDE